MQGIRLSVFMEHGVDNVFYCWVRRIGSEGLAEGFEAHKPSEFLKVSWVEKRYTVFKESAYVKPKGFQTVSLRSRELYPYGVFQLTARLPNWGEGSPLLWFGFEADDLFGGGCLHYRFFKGTLSAYAGAWPEPHTMDLTSFALPPDYATRRHTYSVYVYEGIALWYVDEKLRACAILSHKDSGLGVTIADGPPYSLCIASMKPSTSLAAIIDIDGGDISKEWIWDDFHPWQIRFLPGEPKAKLTLKLYEACTENALAGKTVEDTVTCHPVPFLPFEKGVFYFESSTEGVLVIECFTLTGQWKEYDRVEIQPYKLARYAATDTALALRVRFEPESKPAVIRVAEVMLK